jgi:hypothetical protein
MRKLVFLALALVAALAFSSPALAQDFSDCQYSPQEISNAEECVAEQVAQSLEAATAAAADVATSTGRDGMMDGETAFRAALDAARNTGVDEQTAQAVATRAVASVSTGPEEPANAERATSDEEPADEEQPAAKKEQPSDEKEHEQKAERSEERSGEEDEDEITVLPATGAGGVSPGVAVGAVLMALLVGAGLVLRRIVR